jgi:hypothetical protein
MVEEYTDMVHIVVGNHSAVAVDHNVAGEEDHSMVEGERRTHATI